MNLLMLRYPVTMAQQSGEPSQPLTFITEQANSTVCLSAYGSPPSVSLEYSTNNGAWSTYTVGTTITLQNVGDRCCMRAASASGNTAFATSRSAYNGFVTTGKIKVAGNIQTLLKKDGLKYDIPSSYCFCKLFYGNSAITQAPSLPATTLNTFCYSYMFHGCRSLTRAPALPATTLATRCYWYMFGTCTSLEQVPILPATTLVDYCYCMMFNGCLNLSLVDVSFTAWNPTTATSGWMTSAGSNIPVGSKFFRCPSALPNTIGNNNIPDNWTRVGK